RDCLRKELDDHLSAAHRIVEPAAGPEIKPGRKSKTGRRKSVSESTHHDALHDDGFHEIQLSGKQLVFLFMATTIVAVVIFLCGVQVGRGVKAPATPSPEKGSAAP